ncbi:MAG: hypothetical protein LBS50_09785 [Prevotellaceae bacterium]|jgi:hypothetical protein|nr:hypothetical protein [Prevotellaceae bacterium]
MKTKKYTEIDIEKKISPVLKRHAWWLSVLIIAIIGYATINSVTSGMRNVEDDINKRELGGNLLRLFNYLPNEDSVSAEDVFLSNAEALVTFNQTMLPMLLANKQQQVGIKELYPFLKIIPITIIDSLQDFTDENEAMLYYRYFDYTTLSKADSLTMFPKFHKCIDENNILQFRNFQIFSYFCDTGELPYKKQVLNYRYRKINGKFLCEKYLFREFN